MGVWPQWLAQLTKRSTFVVVFVIFGILALDLSTKVLSNQRATMLVEMNKENVELRVSKYPKPFRPNVISGEREKQTTAQSTTTTTTPATTLPGIVSMDKDLSLPPEVPKRPDSKEPILEYSQRRDYIPLITQNAKCGSKSTAVDLTLNDFDYENDVFLLMVVKSACALGPRRDAIRKSWGDEEWAKKNLGVNVRLVFLLGACQTPDLQKKVEEENSGNHDILQWNFFDSFRNLTLKDCLFMQWYSANCRNVPYVFKGDDDVFVNTRNIVQFVKNTEFAKRENLFVGSVLNGSPRILDPSWKYYVSYNLYPEKYYPPYVSGGGFVMSGHMVSRLFQASLLTRIIPIDDAFLGILLKKIGVLPQNDNGFKSWGMKNATPCRFARIKTFHKMSPSQIVDTWTKVNNLDPETCEKEAEVLKTRTRR